MIRTLVNGRQEVIAPIPCLIFRRFCDGLYYEVCREPGFDSSFGESFQEYVGEVIRRGLKTGGAKIFPEQEYHVGKELKRTIDWIIEKKSVARFIECKTKRLAIGAKLHLDSDKALNSELEKMADFVTQVYKTINDYKKGHYPHYPFAAGKKIFPLVVTLEDWFLLGSNVHNEIAARVADGFSKEGLPQSLLQAIPYSVCSMQEC